MNQKRIADALPAPWGRIWVVHSLIKCGGALSSDSTMAYESEGDRADMGEWEWEHY